MFEPFKKLRIKVTDEFKTPILDCKGDERIISEAFNTISWKYSGKKKLRRSDYQ